MFQGYLKEVVCRAVSKVFQEVSKKLCVREVSKVFQEVSKKFPGSFQSVKRKF